MKQGKLRKRLISCALALVMLLSLVPTMAMAATPGAKEKTWTGMPDGDVLVKDTITQITNSVVEHEVVANTTAGNDQKIDYMCRINLGEKTKIVACYGQDDASKWGMVSTTAQAAAYEANHPGETVVAAINSDFFNMGTGEPMGALVMDGKQYHGANDRWYFAILKDGTPVIRNSADLSDCQQAVGGMVPLVKDGQLCPENFYLGEDDYSRCTIGIMEDGSVVTAVTHGRLTPVSCGRTYKEIAEMYQRAGCVDALVLDGGGSATYAARIEGSNKLEVRNSPSDGAEREVSSTLLIVSSDKPSGVFDHVAITPNNELYTPNSQVQFVASGVDTAGFPVEVPAGITWALADTDMGAIDANSGKFTASSKTGTVTVLMKDQSGKEVGSTTIEIVVPDHIYFNTEEVSLGFEAESDLNLVVRNKDRDIHIKDGDLKWTCSTEGMGTFVDNIFIANADNSLNGNVTATSAYDENVSGTIHVIVGMLPSVVWDFEDHMDETTGDITLAKDYYVGANGILSTSNYARGGNESIDIVSIDDDEPVRFGSHALKLNYDFTDCGAVTEGACVGTSDEMAIPGAPTGLGVWVYAPKGVGVPYGSVKDADGNLISGLWLRCYCNDGSGTKCEVNFTLEPKDGLVQDGYNAETDEWTVQPGIYWEGWQYLEADLTKWSGPFSFQPGMTFRLMFVAGINMVGTQRTGELYFDNFQFVYGTNIDDVDAPVVDSIRVNDAMLSDGETLHTNTLNINAYLHDVQNKYTTGIDAATVRMYVDGNNTMDNPNYQYIVEPDGSIAHLYDVKLADGMHSVTASVRDGFGNETTETRYFLVDTNTENSHTEVSVVPEENTAILGNNVNLDIVATDSDVKSSTTQLRFGNLFKEYEVTFSDNYNGTYSYSKLSDTLTINAERKDDASADDGNVIATVSVKVPATLNESNVFSYTVKGGSYTTEDGYYGSYTQKEDTLPVSAAYQISAGTMLVGREAAVSVLDRDGNGVANVDLYLAQNNEKIGTTDENGEWNTMYFSNAAGTTWIYAKDADGLLSFQYKVNSYAAAGEADAMPYGLMFNALNDSAHGKSMTWLSNVAVAPAQSIRYRVSGTDDWTTVEADTTLRTFSKGGNSAVNLNSVVLSGLTPGTSYEYQIGGGDAWSDVDTFTTVNVDKNKTQFFVLGDIQAEDTTNIERIVTELGQGYDFGIQTGDAVDDATAYEHWNDITDLFGTKRFGSTDIIHVLGNHEYAGDANASAAHQFYNLPTQPKAGSYYSMTYGDVYMAVVNYTGTASQLKEAMNWLEKDATASDATWKVLLMHQPAYYTNGVGGNAEIYNTVPDVAEAAGIDVVFSGHDHSAAMTWPLRDDARDDDNGVVYCICGSSGEKSYPITSQEFFDYDKIFDLTPTIDFTATYLTASADENEMTINYYDIDRGLMKSITLETPCFKNGHDYQYNPDDGSVVCTNCDRHDDKFSGEIADKNGNKYYLMGGVAQTGWFMIGDDVFYATAKGVLQEITLVSDTPTTCTVRGKMVYNCKTVDAGDENEYTVRHAMAAGHSYDNPDPKAANRVCTVCGWKEVSLKDCKVRLSYNSYTYTGKQIKPIVYVTAPDGTELTSYYDFTTTYGENTKCGYGSVTVKPKNSGYNVNITEKRGSLCDDGAVVELTFPIHAATVQNVRSSMTNDGIRVTWTPVAEADGYNIYLWNSTKQAYVKDKSVVGGSKGAVTVYGVTAGKAYDIKVCAYNKVGNDEVVGYGNVTHITVPKTYKKALAAPVITASNSSSTGYVKLTWDKVANADKYEVYRADYKDGTYKLMYTTTNTTYTNTSSKAGYTYYYKVKAVNSAGAYQSSVYSNVVSRTCDCAKPVVTASVNAGTGKPHLSWNAVSGANKYVIYRSTDGTNFSKYYTTTATYFNNISAVAGKTYSYKVQAVSNRTTYADSVLSAAKSVTAK